MQQQKRKATRIIVIILLAFVYLNPNFTDFIGYIGVERGHPAYYRETGRGGDYDAKSEKFNAILFSIYQHNGVIYLGVLGNFIPLG